MKHPRLFPVKTYFRKCINTFFPRFLFRLSPTRNWAQNHWRGQRAGDPHGYDKYTIDHPRIPVLIKELQAISHRNDSILDLGCNCGYYLHFLKKEGYTNLHGIDISPEAVTFGKANFDLEDVDIVVGSFEDVLPLFEKQGRKFELVYSLGATLELVHPSFDIIHQVCQISERYILLIINEWGHAYPRFWEYEFSRNGFLPVKCIRPFNGSTPGGDLLKTDTLIVFERVCRKDSP